MSDTEEKPRGKPIIIKNATDLQRLKLEKLMKHPDKEILIPEKPKERGMPVVPEFVRNVMGSSAGAGSGEFHVYRHLRRKEYARQKFMKEKGERERLDDEYHEKLEDYKRKADQKTAKKRAKRLKRKEKIKTKPKTDSESSKSEEEVEKDPIEVSKKKDQEEKEVSKENDQGKEVNKENDLEEVSREQNVEEEKGKVQEEVETYQTVDMENREELKSS